MSLEKTYKEFRKEIKNALSSRQSAAPRVGAELKFPLVKKDGSAAGPDAAGLLWEHLSSRGWNKQHDPVSASVTGCAKKGKQNQTVASTETGFAKAEFSLAHEENLFEVEKSLRILKSELKEFQEKHNAFFLCHGIHPVSKPCKKLMAEKSRTSVWDSIFKSNNHIPESEGDDMHLFTVNAASHVHISVSEKELIPLVNILNGFSCAQIALTANSSVWKGAVDAEHKCASETFWDRWIPEPGRVGVPEKPFRDLKDYVRAVSGFKPVYVTRKGIPVLLPDYKTFREYFSLDRAKGLTTSGEEVVLEPSPEDLKLHNTLYWFNARISGYYTVENRLMDQQPEDALLAPSALTLGLSNAIGRAWEELSSFSWEKLRKSRVSACKLGAGDDFSIKLDSRMLAAAEAGLKKRSLGEEVFLEPLFRRLKTRRCPADESEEIFKSGGIKKLIENRSLK